ncbi:MAG: hypothetical protein PHU65_00025 [Actinomycetota bacterium]|nr:hypothetical protein [Actinomycetota bacterium]
MKNQNLIISEVNKIISKEIKFLNSYYNYDLKRFCCPDLFYSPAFLAFFNIEEIQDFKIGESHKVNNHIHEKENIVLFDTYKIINLVAGIELLVIGLKIHASQESIFRKTFSKSEEPEKIIDKNYTIELLFGDIFYSRAISYLINFDDFIIFDNILRSILSTHQSRIIIHQRIKDMFNDSKNIKWFFNEGFSQVKMLNALLKEILFTGLGVSNFDVSGEKTKDFLLIIDKIILLKTYDDLIDYIGHSLPGTYIKDNYSPVNYFKKEAIVTKKVLELKINKLKPEWIKKNFLKLFFKFA